MSIQFCCTQCGQPIEVDDQHAGQTAACPYCRHMVSVPPESTYHPETAVAARPTPPPSGETPTAAEPVDYTQAPPAGSARPHTARTWGNYCLVSTALILLLFVSAIARAFVLFAKFGLPQAQTAPSADEMRKMQLQIGTDPWLAGSMMGALFFAVVTLVLGIVSLAQSRRGNWRGILGVAIGGLFVLCVCGANIVGLLMGLGAPAGG